MNEVFESLEKQRKTFKQFKFLIMNDIGNIILKLPHVNTYLEYVYSSFKM